MKRSSQKAGYFEIPIGRISNLKNLTDWLWEQNINFKKSNSALIFQKASNPTIFEGLETKVRNFLASGEKVTAESSEPSLQTRSDRERIERGYARISRAKGISETLTRTIQAARQEGDDVIRYAERQDNQRELKELNSWAIREASKVLRHAGINAQLIPGELDIENSGTGRLAGTRVIRQARLTLIASYPFTDGVNLKPQTFRVAMALSGNQMLVEGLCDTHGDLHTVTRASLADIREADKKKSPKKLPGSPEGLDLHKEGLDYFATYDTPKAAKDKAKELNKKSAQRAIIESPEDRSVIKADPELEAIRQAAIDLNRKTQEVSQRIQAFSDALVAKASKEMGLNDDAVSGGYAGLQSAAQAMADELQQKLKDLPANFIEFADKVTYAKVQSVRLNDASWKDMIDAAKVRGKGMVKRVANILDKISILFKKLTVDVNLQKFEPGELTGKKMDQVINKNKKALDRVNQYDQTRRDVSPDSQKYFLDEAEGQIQRPQRLSRKVISQAEMGIMLIEELSESLDDSLEDIQHLNAEVEALLGKSDRELVRNKHYPLPKTATIPKFSSHRTGPLIPRRSASKVLAGFSAEEQLQFRNA